MKEPCLKTFLKRTFLCSSNVQIFFERTVYRVFSKVIGYWKTFLKSWESDISVIAPTTACNCVQKYKYFCSTKNAIVLKTCNFCYSKSAIVKSTTFVQAKCYAHKVWSIIWQAKTLKWVKLDNLEMFSGSIRAILGSFLCFCYGNVCIFIST